MNGRRSWLDLWWRQPDRFNQLSSHLHAAGFAAVTRANIAGIAGLLACAELGTLWSAARPRTTVELACTLGAVGGASICSLIWARRWPTRAQSWIFAVVSSASIAMAALSQHDPAVALLACTAFATVAGYTAVFHTAPLTFLNFALALVVGSLEAARFAAAHDPVTAACEVAVVLLMNLSVPFSIQAVVVVLGTEAVLAERDPLTRLLTRRAFSRRAIALIEQGRVEAAHFVVAVIDLDRFKQLNDSYGHSAGDDALVSVARALRDAADGTAVTCRSGGEEFVIADTWSPDDVSRKAQQLCDVIAALPLGITASIGTAGVHPAYRPGDSGALLMELIAAADAAMYDAKRRGGNQAREHQWPLPPALDAFRGADADYRNDDLIA